MRMIRGILWYMTMPRPASRRATNVTLPEPLLREARACGINLSQAAASGIEAAIKQARREGWRRENAVAIESWNDFTEAHGMPLAEYRQF